jgi:ferredoxin
MIYFNIGPDGQLYNSPLGICGRCEVKIESGNVCVDCMTPSEKQMYEIAKNITPDQVAKLLQQLEQLAEEDWKQWRLL